MTTEGAGLVISLALLVVSHVAYTLGRLHRNRTFVRTLHLALMSNLSRGHDTRLAEDVMLVSLIVGVHGESEHEYIRILSRDRDRCRAEARAFIQTLVREG